MAPDWIIFAILSAVFAALVAIFGKIGVSDIDSTLATTVRAFIMAGFLTIVSFALGKFKMIGTIHSKAFLFIVLSGIAGAMSWLFYFFALKRGPLAGVVSLDRLSVIFAVLLAILFLGENFTWKTILGAVLISAGAILVSIK